MKKNILKRIGLIALAVCVAIGSFFVPVTKKQSNIACANNVTENYIFDGSNIMVPIWRNGNNTYMLDYGFISFRLFKRVDDQVFVIQLWDCSLYVARDTSNYNYYIADSLKFYYNGAGYDYYNLSYSNTSYWFDQIRGVDMVYTANNVTYYTSMGFYVSSAFNNNVVSVEIGNNNTNESIYFTGSHTYFIKYFDSNNNYVYFEFKNYEGSNSKLEFDDRTYYFSPDFSDSQIYNEGYQNGLADNQQNIYNNGYNAGYDVGFGAGRSEGIVDSNQYSFVSLIGSVVDVPLQTFLGLLSFDILGINISNFIFALLTLAFIIFIIKLIMGK